ncbi:hypothetical protein [Cytobacillus firmus]|uniref:hypothetical protein n=1 Tax=Cytobacillus firmus TaxID=1399 RepID=UPI001C9483F2|nr:hypothetical protein [Cytobacillus firmus]MBY6053315.1 hypothetical protein [Cytobacillus firmus]
MSRIKAMKNCNVCNKSLEFETTVYGQNNKSLQITGVSHVFGSEPGKKERRLKIMTFVKCDECKANNVFTYKYEEAVNEMFFFDLKMND